MTITLIPSTTKRRITSEKEMKTFKALRHSLLILAVLPAACQSFCFLCRLLPLPGCKHHCGSSSSESSEEVSSSRRPTTTAAQPCSRPLNSQCINPDSYSVELICRQLVYECVCGDSPANNTMYDYCRNVISDVRKCAEQVSLKVPAPHRSPASPSRKTMILRTLCANRHAIAVI
ncbi:hypothetical protein DdX_18920 [Ditylenchus destructor]|uniref:Uncharacterized protein n=1 Tax=Ditylenchus destructor TaxID=166010 RepID=A0AAD4MKA5_9BILA|nr:hypothetical protein DdX_18920 [Ditylenchus destructor]